MLVVVAVVIVVVVVGFIEFRSFNIETMNVIGHQRFKATKSIEMKQKQTFHEFSKC